MLTHERARSRRRAPLYVIVIFVLAFAIPAGAQRVVTSQYDNARTGAHRHETRLTPRNVNAQQLGKLFTLHVDGEVYAQPLFVSGVEISGKGRHDVLFVATEHDSVYAFDAYSDGPPLWQVSFVKDGETTVPADDVQCPFIAPTSASPRPRSSTRAPALSMYWPAPGVRESCWQILITSICMRSQSLRGRRNSEAR
jgi:hypothetical protein